MKTTVKETSTAMKQTKSSAVSLGSSISATLSKFGIYTSMALACRKLFEEFKQGVEYVKYLDESLECWRTNVEIRYRKIKQNR